MIWVGKNNGGRIGFRVGISFIVARIGGIEYVEMVHLSVEVIIVDSNIADLIRCKC